MVDVLQQTNPLVRIPFRRPMLLLPSWQRAVSSRAGLSLPAQLRGRFFCLCGPRLVADGPFHVGALGRGRCNRRDKSSGPPPLQLSFKVKRNGAHGQSSAFFVAAASWLNARDRLRPPRTRATPDLRRTIERRRARQIPNRRSQPGRCPCHGAGLANDLVDMQLTPCMGRIAIRLASNKTARNDMMLA